MPDEPQTVLAWQRVPRIRPNALEAWSLLFWAGLLWHVPRALASEGGFADPAFIGPFRGGTRAVGCLWHADVMAALSFNPLAVILMLVISLGVLRWLLVLLLGRRPVLQLNRRGSLILAAAAVIALGLNWAYVLASGAWRLPYPY